VSDLLSIAVVMPSGQGPKQAAELALAFMLSSLIGVEREWRQKSAGLRTHALVGTGAALFVLVSKYGFTDVLGSHVILDPSRVAAQVVTGIGFIGGGLIFVRGDAGHPAPLRPRPSAALDRGRHRDRPPAHTRGRRQLAFGANSKSNDCWPAIKGALPRRVGAATDGSGRGASGSAAAPHRSALSIPVGSRRRADARRP
jgi:hypothetical protein